MSVRTTDYLSPAEFSECSGLSLATIYRRVRDRSLPSAQPGGPRTQVLIPIDALRPAARPTESEPRPSASAVPTGPANAEPIPPVPLPGPAPKWRRAAAPR
jgi:hypothetical protein